MRPKRDGTKHESDTRDDLRARGFRAARYDEGGVNDVSDVWANDPIPTEDSLVVLHWKRLIGDGSRRKPDGERNVVVLAWEDFLDLIELWTHPIQIECKARQNVNVTRELAKARAKVEKARGRA